MSGAFPRTWQPASRFDDQPGRRAGGMAVPRPAAREKRRPPTVSLSLPPVGRLVRRGFKLLFYGVASFAVLVGISLALIFGYMYAHESTYFLVEPNSVMVTGLVKLSRSEVMEVAGLNKPINYLTLNSQAVKNSLKYIPWIDRVDITRSFPNGIKINIVEFEPKAIVNLEYLYYIDSQGMPFKKLEPGEISSLPIISGFSIDELQNKGPLVKDGLDEVFSLVEILSKRTDDFRLDNISEFHRDPDRGLTIFTKGAGLQVKVGRGGFEKKIWRLGRVMDHLLREDKARGLGYVNLDCPPRVTVSYKRPGGA
jgi:cell division protein FtsQ